VKRNALGLVSWVLAVALAACADERGAGAGDAPAGRAYVVSLESDELTVIDLDALDVIGRVATGGLGNHMAELDAGFGKVFVTSSETDEVIVVDARTLAVVGRIAVGRHPTHLSLSRDGGLLAVMAEGEDAVSFVDPERELEVKRLAGFHGPHFMRYTPDGRHGWVANAGSNHLTRVDLATLEIDGVVPLDGDDGTGLAPGEGGFHDAQIDPRGVLWAAHAATGRVIVYDTLEDVKLGELAVGSWPWVVFAEHPFGDLPLRHVVPSFGDRTLTVIDGEAGAVSASLPGDEESYGVNYSPLAPGKAFVMNRVRQDVAVVDTATGAITTRLPVGGNTETASTTADGRWVVATVSGADRVVVIDAEAGAIAKTLDGIGRYPWSITIPGGQNYCH
jgi:YVTN family beta-propeller protein